MNAPRTRMSASTATSGLFGGVLFADTTARMPTLPFGQAWTQSRQNVQSKLPVFFGWNRRKPTNGRDLRQVLADEVQVSFAAALPGPTGNRLLDFAQTRHQFG